MEIEQRPLEETMEAHEHTRVAGGLPVVDSPTHETARSGTRRLRRMGGPANSGTLDVIVVGAGQAGLGVAYFLKRQGRRFVVLEQGRIGETWRSQRWDSFAVNTPNWLNGLPGSPYPGPEPDGFYRRDELVAAFERHAQDLELPIRTGVTVTSVEASASGGFEVRTEQRDASAETLTARNVVVAAGALRVPKIPSPSAELPVDIHQLHSADYRSAGALPPGAVAVVGGGQSGVQIAEDLLHAGRTVYLFTSRVPRLPRRYRGRDVLDWWAEMGFLDVTAAELPDPGMRFMAQPQISGIGRHGHTLSLQQLARDGVRLRGRLVGVEGDTLVPDDRLVDHVQFADERSGMFKADIDAYLERGETDAPPLEGDPADIPADLARLGTGASRVDLRSAGISSVIWATGFKGDFSWIRLPVIDDDGRPIHQRGVSPISGLYFLGFPWLHSRKSGLIAGIEEDAGHVVDSIARVLA